MLHQRNRQLKLPTTSKGMASIFCDGACSGNGTRNALGGWAWAFWTGAAVGEPDCSDSAKLEVPPIATNQRAELKALLESLRWASSHPEYSITIYTDSMYAINCTSKWGPGWKRKGWKRDSGEPLQNLDLIKPLVDLWKPCWILQHVRGHQTGSGPLVHGNNWVDKAAVVAAHGSPLTNKVLKHSVLTLDIPESPRSSSSSTMKGDTIEHVIDSVPRSKSNPPSNPIPIPKKAAGKADVKQADIRMWFSAP